MTLLAFSQDLQTLILVNCGATEDVTQLVEIQESVRVIVIDSHRPFHHNWNDNDCKSLLAFCNPADGSCDNIPEADVWSGISSAAAYAWHWFAMTDIATSHAFVCPCRQDCNVFCTLHVG